MACTDGDITRLFEAHYAWLCRLVVRMLRDRERSHEVVMEVFLEVYARRETIELVSAPAYLKRAVVNRTLTELARRTTERGAVDRATRQGRLPGVESAGTSVEHQVTESHFVLSLVEQLPAQQKIAVVLKYYGDLLESDVADAMGVSPGTVKAYLFRARERLQREYLLREST